MSDFDEPTNPLLADALRDHAEAPTPEMRRAVFEEFIAAEIMVPAKQGDAPLHYARLNPADGESVEIVLAVASDGPQVVCAFINGAEFVAWARQHPFLVMSGRDVCSLAVSNGTPRVILNPAGEEMQFIIHADELVSVANGEMPDGEERPESTLPAQNEAASAAPAPGDGQLQIGPSPAPLDESEATRVVAACQQVDGVTGALLIGILIPGQPGPVRAVVLEVQDEPDQAAQEAMFVSVQKLLAAQEGEPIALGFTVGFGPVLEAARQIGDRLF